jgi:HSP20 family protein
MNILDNKELLRGLLKQSDILNTIHGGSVSTSAETFFTAENMIVKIFAPSVNPEAYNVVLNNNELIIFSVVTEGTENKSADELMAVPMYLEKFKIPARVDTDKIEALLENGELRVILPFRTSEKNRLRQIKIKQL